MPQFANYEVWIHVDGKKLPEYGVQHTTRADRTEITCWIPSEVGKAFEVYYKDSIRAFATGLWPSVDGNQCPGCLLHARGPGPLGSRDFFTQKGVSVSDNSYRPFVFSNCQLIDDDEFVSPSPDPGQITVDIQKVAIGEYVTRKKADTIPEPKVHERSKKGMVHGIQLGPECSEKQSLVRATTTIQHLVTFKFKYRPLDVLRADGIVPQSTPTLNDEEARIQALKEELRVLEARQHQKKRKRSDSETLPQRVKQEPSFALDNEVIDLT